MNSKHKFLFFSVRHFSQTSTLNKRFKYIKYPNVFEEHPRSERTALQRLTNSGRKLAPYDKRFPVTGKGTGPGVEGGSVEALRLGSLHVVPPTGFVNKHGQFKHVKELHTEFVVPDLKDFHLKPYVPYNQVPDIEKDKHTAREIFDTYYADEVKEEFYSRIEGKKVKKKTLLSRFKKS